MKKLPRKFQVPLIISIMMPTMLLGLPALMLYTNLPAGTALFEPWLDAVSKTIPLALPMAITAGTLARLFVSKVLIEAE